MKPSRRSILAGTTACLFDIVPSSVFAQPAPSDRINIGHIGMGGRSKQFLRVGGLGLLGGLTLPDLLRARAAAASAGSVVKDRSVVLLFAKTLKVSSLYS